MFLQIVPCLYILSSSICRLIGQVVNNIFLRTLFKSKDQRCLLQPSSKELLIITSDQCLSHVFDHRSQTIIFEKIVKAWGDVCDSGQF